MDLLMAVVGWLGAALLVAAYAMVTRGRLAGPDVVYQLMNLVGAVCLLGNTAYLAAWPSAFLNAVWLVIGMGGILQARRAVEVAEP